MRRPFNLFNLLKLFKNKRAMSTAISSIIMLTATVVMSSSVVLYATNVSTGQMAKEGLIMPTTHLWYVNETSSVAAVGVTNTGSTDIIINKLTIKGIDCEWNASSDSFVLYNRTVGALPGDLQFVDITRPETNTTITIAGEPYEFNLASQGISLKAGSSMAIYIAVPNNLMIYDTGQPVRLSIQTTQTVYTIEANVETTA